MSLFVPFFKCRLNHFRLAPKFSDSTPENALSSAGFPGHGRATGPALTLLVVVWRGVPGPRPPVARCLCPHEPRGRWPSGPLSPQKNDRGELSVHREFSYGSEVTLGGWTGKRRASGCVFRRLLRTLTSTNTTASGSLRGSEGERAPCGEIMRTEQAVRALDLQGEFPFRPESRVGRFPERRG